MSLNRGNAHGTVAAELNVNMLIFADQETQKLDEIPEQRQQTGHLFKL